MGCALADPPQVWLVTTTQTSEAPDEALPSLAPSRRS